MTLEEWIARLGDVNSSRLPIMLWHETVELKEFLIELQQLRQLKHDLNSVFGDKVNLQMRDLIL